MKQVKHITVAAHVAGIDVGKRWLDVWSLTSGEHQRFERTSCGLWLLVSWLRDQDIVRVGLEATGGYERIVCEALHDADFEIVVHQPAQVRYFAKSQGIRAKSDKMDARLIAEATASRHNATLYRPSDSPTLTGLMTLYQHIATLLAEAKTFAEHVELEVVEAIHQSVMADLESRKAEVLRSVLAVIRKNASRQARFDLLKSLPGIGPVVAAGLLAYMPELGSLAHGQPAALLGVAPFDSDSGEHRGKRFIVGGRRRPRDLMYLSALAAKRMDTPFRLFYDRLITAGKPAKLAIVAVMRKLIETANLVLKRQTPWVRQIG